MRKRNETRRIVVTTQPMTQEERKLLLTFLQQCKEDYFEMVQDAAMKEEKCGWTCEEVDKLEPVLDEFIDTLERAIENLKEEE